VIKDALGRARLRRKNPRSGLTSSASCLVAFRRGHATAHWKRLLAQHEQGERDRKADFGDQPEASAGRLAVTEAKDAGEGPIVSCCWSRRAKSLTANFRRIRRRFAGRLNRLGACGESKKTVADRSNPDFHVGPVSATQFWQPGENRIRDGLTAPTASLWLHSGSFAAFASLMDPGAVFAAAGITGPSASPTSWSRPKADRGPTLQGGSIWAGAAVIAAVTNALEGREFSVRVSGGRLARSLCGRGRTIFGPRAPKAAGGDGGRGWRAEPRPRDAGVALGAGLRQWRRAGFLMSASPGFGPSPNLSYAIVFPAAGLGWAEAAMKRGRVRGGGRQRRRARSRI